MAGNEDDKDKAVAEKAYEAAASSASEKAKASAAEVRSPSAAPASSAAKPADVKPAEVKPEAPVVKTEAVEAIKPTPATPEKAPAKPQAEAAAPKAETPAPKAKAPAAKAKAVPAAKTKPAAPKPSTASVAKALPKPAPAAKPAPAPVPAPAAKPAAAAIEITKAKPVEAAKPAEAKPKIPVSKAAPKTADVRSLLIAGLFPNFLLEEKTMDMSANFTGIHEAMNEAQAKAKAAFEKSTAMLGEVTDFTKGNVEAIMESGKILADGVQSIGSELVAEGRATFENISGDIKELAAAKSPTDFFKVQGDMMRKNFDSAVAYGAKNSEAMLKLMSDAIAPISGRVSVAMEKARQTSL